MWHVGRTNENAAKEDDKDEDGGCEERAEDRIRGKGGEGLAEADGEHFEEDKEHPHEAALEGVLRQTEAPIPGLSQASGQTHSQYKSRVIPQTPSGARLLGMTTYQQLKYREPATRLYGSSGMIVLATMATHEYVFPLPSRD